MLRSFLFVSMTLIASASLRAAERYDLLLKNGRVVDGSGTPWYYGDVAILGGKIARIGRIPEADAARVIDARGLIIAPGFIDMMGQTATPFLRNPASAINLLTQGVTTINAGEGESAAPLTDEDGKRAGWTTMTEYFALLDKTGMPINAVQTVGHTQVRRVVLGEVDRRPSPAEMDRMRDLVREAMQAGAIGVSTALIYPPAVYAPTEEIIDLVKIAGEYNGGYYTHMRNEGDRLLEAIDEALAIGAGANARVHIFHLKAAGRQNWGKMELAIARIKAARAAGQQVAADIYPYINNGLGATALIHPRHATEGPNVLRRKLDDAAVRAEIRSEMETAENYENWFRHCGFDWDRVMIGGLRDGVYAAHNGKSVAAIGLALSKDPWDVFFDAARNNAFAMPQTMSEANLVKAMREEFISFCTDVGPAGGSSIASHPRAYGAFPRVLSRYVRDLGVISLERAVAQMSAVAANEVLLHDRGRIAPGLAADLVVFDLARVADSATFANPQALSAGMTHVIVNGEVVLQEGKYTGAKPGRVLRGPGFTGK